MASWLLPVFFSVVVNLKICCALGDVPHTSYAHRRGGPLSLRPLSPSPYNAAVPKGPAFSFLNYYKKQAKATTPPIWSAGAHIPVGFCGEYGACVVRWVGCIFRTQLRRDKQINGTHHNGTNTKSRKAKRQKSRRTPRRHLYGAQERITR